MDEITQKLLLILLIVGYIPLTYIGYYFLIELPKKYGYWKFSLLLLSYILIIVVNTYFLSTGLVGLLTFILVPILIQLIGVYWFRKEISDELKKTWQQMRED